MQTEKKLSNNISFEDLTESKPEVLNSSPVKPSKVYVLEDIVLSKINLDKNLVLRVIENANGKFVDIRRFYKEYPTKKGVRFSYASWKKIGQLIDI